jgi:hypothetical protein
VLITLTMAFAIVGSGLAGCKKEIVQAPNVVFSRPYVNQSFGFGDTIWVDASVSHPELQKVTLTLVNENYQPVEEVSNIAVNGNSFSFKAYIVVKNKAISSGKHFVRVQVLAQNERFNNFVQVNVSELQRQRLAIYAAASDGFTQYLYRIENGSKTLSQSAFGDASAVATNSYFSGVFLAPAYLGNLKLYRTTADSLIWQDQNNATNGARFMRGLYSSETDVFGFYADGRVARFGINGGLKFVFQMPIGFQAIAMLKMENYLLVVGENGPQANKALFYFNETTGALIRKIDLLGHAEHVALLAFDASTVAVLYNDANGKASWEGFQLNGIFINLPALPNFTFTAAAYVADGQMALGTDLGVYHFKYLPLNFLPISQVVPTVLVYDELNSQLLVGAGSSLSLRSFPTMQIVWAHSFVAHLEGVAVLYNK